MERKLFEDLNRLGMGYAATLDFLWKVYLSTGDDRTLEKIRFLKRLKKDKGLARRLADELVPEGKNLSPLEDDLLRIALGIETLRGG